MKCTQCGKKLTGKIHFEKFGALFGSECIKKVENTIDSIDPNGSVRLAINSLTNKRQSVLGYITWERPAELFSAELRAAIRQDINSQTAKFWFDNLDEEGVDLALIFIRQHIELEDEFGTIIYKGEEKQALKLMDKYPYLNDFRREVMKNFQIARRQNEISREQYAVFSEETMRLPILFWMKSFINYNCTTFRIADNYISA